MTTLQEGWSIGWSINGEAQIGADTCLPAGRKTSQMSTDKTLPTKKIFLFTGKEEFLKEKELEKVKADTLGEDASAGINFDRFCAGQDSIERITDCARTIPFMSEKRLIAVDNADKFSPEEKEALASFLKASLPPWCVVVLNFDAESKPQDAFVKNAACLGSVREFDLSEPAKLIKWVVDKFAHSSKRMGEGAARHLLANTGSDLRQVDSAAELVITYAGGRRTISKDDIDAVIERSIESGVFELADAIGLKDGNKALRILSGLFAEGKRAPEILGSLGWHMRRLWRAKNLLASGKAAPSDVAGKLGVPRSLRGVFLRQASNFKLAEIENGLKAVAQADIAVKSSMLPAVGAVEFLTVRLISGINPAVS